MDMQSLSREEAADAAADITTHSKVCEEGG